MIISEVAFRYSFKNIWTELDLIYCLQSGAFLQMLTYTEHFLLSVDLKDSVTVELCAGPGLPQECSDVV